MRASVKSWQLWGSFLIRQRLDKDENWTVCFFKEKITLKYWKNVNIFNLVVCLYKNPFCGKWSFIDFRIHKYFKRQPPGVFCKIKRSLKIRKFHSKTPVLESLFNKFAGLQHCTLLKRDPNTGVLLRDLKNI